MFLTLSCRYTVKWEMCMCVFSITTVRWDFRTERETTHCTFRFRFAFRGIPPFRLCLFMLTIYVCFQVLLIVVFIMCMPASRAIWLLNGYRLHNKNAGFADLFRDGETSIVFCVLGRIFAGALGKRPKCQDSTGLTKRKCNFPVVIARISLW